MLLKGSERETFVNNNIEKPNISDSRRGGNISFFGDFRTIIENVTFVSGASSFVPERNNRLSIIWLVYIRVDT